MCKTLHTVPGMGKHHPKARCGGFSLFCLRTKKHGSRWFLLSTLPSPHGLQGHGPRVAFILRVSCDILEAPMKGKGFKKTVFSDQCVALEFKRPGFEPGLSHTNLPVP